MTTFVLLVVLIPIASILLALGLTVFVLSRRASAWVNRLLASGCLLFGLHQAALLAADSFYLGAWRPALYKCALSLAALFPVTWFGFTLLLGEHNGGQRFSRWLPVLVGIGLFAPIAWGGMVSGLLVAPLYIGAQRILVIGVEGWGKAFLSGYVMALVLILLHLENLYRQAERITRHRIKYLVVGLLLIFAVQIVAVSYALLNGFLHALHGLLTSAGFLAGELLVAFAIIRHRLLDVDIFISRYIVYRSLTLALVGGYLFSLGLTAEAFRRYQVPLDLLTGTLLALVGAVALAILFMSEDVRRRVQIFINTHFFRHKYDYRVEWVEYTRRLAKAIEIPEIAVQTVNRIIEVMWVRQAAVYATGERPTDMGLQYQEGFDNLPQTLHLSPGLIERLRSEGRELAAEARQYAPATPRPETARDLFSSQPIGLIVPIMALDTLAGLLVVGPEATGKPLGLDDRDLLAAVAAQAGALMVNARLVREASEGRELQILARLSAFVVHDLKNAASSLGMLADNAALHIHRPEFQADAIRTLRDVTDRMRTLITTLTSPDIRTVGQPRPMNLAVLVESWAKDLATQVAPRITLEAKCGPTLEVDADPDQFRSVLQNLTMNAIEAIPDKGSIFIETYTENGAAFLVVSDTGRGMSPDFIRKRLFRPFQTTKKRGLGIGLYQCQQIVRQFNGTLTAESEEGKGTRMIVRLPVVPSSAASPTEP